MTKDILYPPLDTKSDTSILSENLTRNFDAVHKIHESKMQLEMNHSDSFHSHKDDALGADGRKEFQAKKYKVAVAAAVAVESEIATLKKAITELESMLFCSDSPRDIKTVNYPYPVQIGNSDNNLLPKPS